LIGVVFLPKKQSSTLNHKPQLGPQHRHHHDEVQKNGISYAVDLMQSITYRRICLVNRKTAIVAKMTPHVGIRSEMRKPFVCRLGLSCDPQGHVTIRLHVLRYGWVGFKKGEMSGMTMVPTYFKCLKLPDIQAFA
jgi:hypothetical protein